MCATVLVGLGCGKALTPYTPHTRHFVALHRTGCDLIGVCPLSDGAMREPAALRICVAIRCSHTTHGLGAPCPSVSTSVHRHLQHPGDAGLLYASTALKAWRDVQLLTVRTHPGAVSRRRRKAWPSGESPRRAKKPPRTSERQNSPHGGEKARIPDPRLSKFRA